MRLRSLVIRELQGVAPTTLEFGDGIHVLLGKNGTGKTTLLCLLVAIVRTDFRAMLDQNFDFSYTLESPGLELDVTARNQLPTHDASGNGRKPTKVSSPERATRHQSSKHELVVRVTLTGFKEIYELRYIPGKGTLTRPGGQQKVIPPFDLSQRGSLHARMSVLYSELDGRDKIPIVEFAEGSSSTSGRFDEALDVFAALTGGARENSNYGVPSFVWAAIETRGFFDDYSFLPFVPFELSFKLFQKLKRVKTPPDSLRLTADEYTPLKRFVELTVYTDASMVLRREERVRRPGTDSYELRFRAPEFHFDLPHDDGDISHEQLSFGEKRLLAFLYYQHANEIVIADELVNGLHHSWIEACLDVLTGRQAFLVSQNPLLLDHLPFNSPDDVRLHLIRCQRGHDGETKMHWRNFSEAEAHAFHRGYETGVQHVSEILIAEGLW